MNKVNVVNEKNGRFEYNFYLHDIYCEKKLLKLFVCMKKMVAF